MPNVLITGANGQLGREIMALAEVFPELTLLPAGREALDISRPDSVRRFFGDQAVDFCVNCAAYTAVDRAESEPDLAYQVNVAGAGRLAEACNSRQIPLIHLSSDYVYHNGLNRPLRETDPTTPQGAYARTKLEGERSVRERQPQSLIVRTSWLYGAFGHNFLHTMLRRGREGGELRVVYDQIGAPTYARDLAAALLGIAGRCIRREIDPGSWAGGVFNYANEGVTSWYDFALAIFEESALDCPVRPIESRDYPTPANRPHFSVLSKNKIKEQFGLDIPHWRTSLRHCLRRLDG